MSNFFKKTIASVFAVATLSLLINPVTINAGFDPNYKLPKESAQAKPITLTQPTTVLGKNGKIKVKVVKNQSGELEIDNQLGAKPTKEQEKAFETCKKEVQKTRTKRYKNKPTPCIKTPVSDGEHTDQDYSILWEGVNQNIERDKGADMNKEIPLSEILKEADVDTCESDTSVSSIITVSSAISTSSAVSSCTAISSSLSTSSSSAISSSSSQLSSSAVSSSSVVSSSNTSSNLSSSSVINSSLQNKQSSTLSSSSTSSRLSVLDMIFGSVKASAATNDGWRLPFESGQRPYLTQTPYGVGTNHSKYSAFDFDGASGNGNIVAAKSGKVVFKQFEAVDSIGKNTLKGFGNHIVIQSGDGSAALYAHLKTIDVKDGDTVDRGKKVGNQGNSGNSTASHLHFETWSRIPCQYNL